MGNLDGFAWIGAAFGHSTAANDKGVAFGLDIVDFSYHLSAECCVPTARIRMPHVDATGAGLIE